MSEKVKGQELTLEVYHTRFSRCLNTYFQCLLRVTDQSNMNETNWECRHKNQLPLIFLTVYYGW